MRILFVGGGKVARCGGVFCGKRRIRAAAGLKSQRTGELSRNGSGIDMNRTFSMNRLRRRNTLKRHAMVASHGRHLRLEALESRWMLSAMTFTVTSPLDNTVSDDGETTLREAITEANRNDNVEGERDTILFQISVNLIASLKVSRAGFRVSSE